MSGLGLGVLVLPGLELLVLLPVMPVLPVLPVRRFP